MTEMSNHDVKKVFLAGHNGMVGSAIARQLAHQDDIELITRSRAELDLCNQAAVVDFFEQHKPDEVYLAAAKVGGIHANSEYPAEFIYENLLVQVNCVDAAHRVGVNKLLQLGSSCIYPRMAEQPMAESALLTRSVMPTNLYGPGDNFHPENSHVVPALIRRFHEAKLGNLPSVTLWGSGSPFREFLHVDDMAKACVWVMGLDKAVLDSHVSPTMSHINVGTGQDCTIAQLATTISDVVGFKGELLWDTTKPDGTPRKLLDVSLLEQMGWQSSIKLADGLSETYDWFQNNVVRG